MVFFLIQVSNFFWSAHSSNIKTLTKAKIHQNTNTKIIKDHTTISGGDLAERKILHMNTKTTHIQPQSVTGLQFLSTRHDPPPELSTVATLNHNQPQPANTHI